MRSATPHRSATHAAHVFHEGMHVVRPAGLVRLDEVRVLLGHVRRADAEPLQPGGLDQPPRRIVLRIGEDRARIGASRLMLSPPSDDGGHRLLLGLDRSRRDLELRRHHQLGRPHGRGAVAVGQTADVVGAAVVGEEVDPGVADETRRHVRSVTTRVHAHRTADRAGHTHRPRQSRPPGVGRTPRQHRQGERCARPHDRDPGRRSARAAPACGRRQLQSGEAGAEMQHQPVEARVRHQQVGAPPDDEGPNASVPRVRPLEGFAQRLPDDAQVVGTLDLDVERGGPAHSVRGERAEWPHQRRPVAERVRQRSQRLARRHHSGDSSRSSGSVVRSPAPRVRQRSPGRSWAATVWRSSSQPAA